MSLLKLNHRQQQQLDKQLSLVLLFCSLVAIFSVSGFERNDLNFIDSHEASNYTENHEGCMLMSFKRTISIPGCVKFELPANVCRGFCMSYSIPSPDDIGPSQDEITDGSDNDNDNDRLNDYNNHDNSLIGNMEESFGNIRQQKRHLTKAEEEPLPRRILQVTGKKDLRSVILGSTDNLLAARSVRNNRWNSILRGQHSNKVDDHDNDEDERQQQQQQQHRQQQQKLRQQRQQLQHLLQVAGEDSTGVSHLVHSSGEQNHQREVINVGQCCNMVDTVDVVVNLRCAFNKTRVLTFKSATRCECFFCKKH